MSRQIVLDTETTGLSAAEGDRVIELGCVELLDRKLTGNNLHLYFNPDRESHEDALRVHGITTAFLADKPRFHEVAEQVREYLQGAELIIHNAPFDMGFLNMEFERLGLPKLSTMVSGVIDSLVMAKELFPGKRNSLDALCDRLEVDNSGRELHGALLDAELLADVYINMTRGQEQLLSVDAPTSSNAAKAGVVVKRQDLSQFSLPVIEPSEAELAAHEAVLAQIDKSSGDKTIWRKTA
ncbi:DNA polymerase III subunit epsilon [Comamonas sp. J-3]|uniref:DNA polymerase III subunit epsilon n=1 Tax=Comamonas trifloxystrobinivorans TaxID=3350256 RepID=UPI00372CAFD0